MRDLVRCRASFCVAGAGIARAAEPAGFSGPVREIGYVSTRGRCIIIAAGARKPLICGGKLGADVWQNAAAS